MTCGCASEQMGYEGYRQYLESQCKFCPVCNRIFCLEHAKIHSRLKHLKGKRMRNLPWIKHLNNHRIVWFDLTLCYICKKSIEVEHDQRDLMRCLKFISVQLDSVKSHTQNLAGNGGWLEWKSMFVLI